MAITTLSSSAFEENTDGARKAADDGPVIITDEGRPAHVLLTIEEYRRLTGGGGSILDMLAMPDDVEFEPPRLGGPFARPAELD